MISQAEGQAASDARIQTSSVANGSDLQHQITFQPKEGVQDATGTANILDGIAMIKPQESTPGFSMNQKVNPQLSKAISAADAKDTETPLAQQDAEQA